MPFAGYVDFADCVAKNASKADPEAYCSTIEAAVKKAGPKVRARKVAPARADSDSDFAESGTVADLEVREAIILLDKAPKHAKVLMVPDGDTYVIPEYDGAWTPPAPSIPVEYDFDLEDATFALAKLARLRKHEKDEPEQAAALKDAIDALVGYINAEATEEGCEGCGHAMGCDCTACDCDNHGTVAEAVAYLGSVIESFADPEFEAAISEVGRRNSSKDAATLRQIIDLVKSLGISDEEVKAAIDSAGDVEPVAEANVDSSATAEALTFREAGAYGEYVTLAEAAPQFDEANRVVWITPIKPGWGNSRDNNYYPTETLKEATEAGRFNHLKMFKDHPRKSDEKDLPERSVKDWFATTREAEWDAVRQKPRVPIKVHDEADFRRMQEAPEQVAFSVLGGGMARPGEVGGRKGRIVEAISKMRSVDWVTEAGAGGGIDFAESASSEELDMDIENLTPEQLAEGNPALYEHLVGLGKALASVGKAEAADARAAAKAKPDTDDVADAAKDAVKESDAPAWASSIIERLDRIESRESAVEATVAADATKAEAAKVVKAAIDATTLPGSAKTAVSERFSNATFGAGQAFADADALKEAVDTSLAEATAILAPFMKGAPVTGLGATSDDAQPTSVREALESRLGDKWGPVQLPRKDQLVFTPEQMGDTRSAATGVNEHIADATPVSEASASVAAGIAAKFGQ